MKTTLFVTLLKNRFLFILIFLVLFRVFMDIAFFSASSDFLLISIMAAYFLIGQKIERIDRFTFVFCLMLLIAMFFSFLIRGTDSRTEKVAVWFVLFFAIGIIQQWQAFKNNHYVEKNIQV